MRLWFRVRHGTSLFGMAWLALTCAAMLALAAGKHATGTQLGNQVVRTEARTTLVDACLAGSVLLGLALNECFGCGGPIPRRLS